jgi:hypothetical protein
MKIALIRGAVLALCTLWAAAASAADQTQSPYAIVLQRYVDDDGLVDYAKLKANGRALLDSACTTFAAATPAEYEFWNEKDRIAFWLNAYNAYTLKLIVDNYPIQPSKGKTKYPANSIRQIPGAWEHKKFRALGRDVSLDEIEHKILRVEFKEPRIHMALVCAAASCPELRREPYRGDVLDTQLDDQSRAFLSDLRKFHIDRDANEVWASPIFDWFVDDFLPGATAVNPRHIAQQMALVAFATQYVPPDDARYLESGKYVVKYFDYDWTLNVRVK